MNERQASFVREYLVDLNATQAAIRAGYSAKTAEQQGPRLLGNVVVQSAIQAAMSKRAARVEVTAEMVVAGLHTEATRDGENASHSARVQAWGLLGRHLGMLNDKIRVEVGPAGLTDAELAKIAAGGTP